VSHKEFLTLDLNKIKTENGIVYDVKGFLDPKLVTKRL